MIARFPFDTNQLELLLAFESADGLEDLSRKFGRDPSVVSRQLKRLQETAPVLEKNRGRWKITELGLQVNTTSRDFLSELEAVVRGDDLFELPQDAALILINTQQAMRSPEAGKPHDPHCEENILKVLAHWRRCRRPIVHVRHVSESTESAFFRSSSGAEFLPGLEPSPDELVVDKTRSSAFGQTELEESLNQRAVTAIVLVGYTASDCLAATAIQGSNLGFDCYVVEDAAVTFPLKGPGGKIHPSSEVHELTMASLMQHTSKILKLSDIVSD